MHGGFDLAHELFGGDEGGGPDAELHAGSSWSARVSDVVDGVPPTTL